MRPINYTVVSVRDGDRSYEPFVDVVCVKTPNDAADAIKNKPSIPPRVVLAIFKGTRVPE